MNPKGATLLAVITILAGVQASNARTTTVATYAEFVTDTTGQVTTGFNGVSLGCTAPCFASG